MDSSKYGKAGFAYMMPLESLDRIITDRALKPKDRTALESTGLSIEVV